MTDHEGKRRYHLTYWVQVDLQRSSVRGQAECDSLFFTPPPKKIQRVK